MSEHQSFTCIDCDGVIVWHYTRDEEYQAHFGHGLCIGCGRIFDGSEGDQYQTYYTIPGCRVPSELFTADDAKMVGEHKPG
jgi:hypothetical protein